MDWSTLRVVDLIEERRMSAGTLSPTGEGRRTSTMSICKNKTKQQQQQKHTIHPVHGKYIHVYATIAPPNIASKIHVSMYCRKSELMTVKTGRLVKYLHRFETPERSSLIHSLHKKGSMSVKLKCSRYYQGCLLGHEEPHKS